MTTTHAGNGKRGCARLLEALTAIVDVSGLSRREIERRLVEHGCGMDVGRLLAGKFELKLQQVLDLSAVLGLHPVELFRLVFKEPEHRSPILVKMASLFASAGDRPQPDRPRARSEPEALEQLAQRLAAMKREVEELQAKHRPSAQRWKDPAATSQPVARDDTA